VLPKKDPPQSPEIAPVKSEASSLKVETSPPKVDAAPRPPPKVDYAIDLFNMLSMDGPSGHQPGPSSSDDNSWAGFQSKCYCSFHIFTKPEEGFAHPRNNAWTGFSPSIFLCSISPR